MNILIIKTGSTISSLQAQGLDFEDWFSEAMALPADSISVCDPTQGELLPELNNLSGLVITGSPAYVTDLAAWNYTIADYCRSAMNAGKPILGVCYGHQLLAWAFDGSVGFNPNGREIGTTEVELTPAAAQDRLFAGLPERFKVQVSHSQSVMQLPADAVLLASNAMDKHQAFRLGGFTWGIQFHPEFTAAIIKAYITERADVIREEGINLDSLMAGLDDTPASTSLLRRFVEIVKETQD